MYKIYFIFLFICQFKFNYVRVHNSKTEIDKKEREREKEKNSINGVAQPSVKCARNIVTSMDSIEILYFYDTVPFQMKLIIKIFNQSKQRTN